MKDKILLVNDIPGYGKVAVQAMMPILTHMGFRVFNLPTALVSNTLDFGEFEILDTTEYMKNTVKVWENLGFTFDCICTGFMVSDEQGRFLTEYLKGKEALKVVDPIMGDNGKLYNGIDPSRIDTMKALCAVGDIVIPNGTEAAFITGRHAGQERFTRQEAKDIIEGLLELGAKSVVITSIKDPQGDHFVKGWDGIRKEWFSVPFTYIPVRFPGTGDMFSAILVGNVMQGKSLEEGAVVATRTLGKLIDANKDNEEKFQGIPVERFYHLF